jgi:hypothetical protein
MVHDMLADLENVMRQRVVAQDNMMLFMFPTPPVSDHVQPPTYVNAAEPLPAGQK